MATNWRLPVCDAWSPQTRRGLLQPESKEHRASGGQKTGGEEQGGSQWALPSSKDSTPESQVLAASFSCRLLMISCSSEPEDFWRHRDKREEGGGGERGREDKGQRERKEDKRKVWQREMGQRGHGDKRTMERKKEEKSTRKENMWVKTIQIYHVDPETLERLTSFFFFFYLYLSIMVPVWCWLMALGSHDLIGSQDLLIKNIWSEIFFFKLSVPPESLLIVYCLQRLSWT